MYEHNWSPWHGCHKISAGCANCYVYRGDAKYDRDASIVVKNKDFDYPVKKDRKGNYKVPSGSTINMCFSSDFFVKDADIWRPAAWAMIKERSDCKFFFITKRIDRFWDCVPLDFEENYKHVSIYCTCENQEMADYRLPIYLNLPIERKGIICEPCLSEINLDNYLKTGKIYQVVAGGESGEKARICKYEWILKIRESCEKYKVKFWFKQTGSYLEKNGKVYKIIRKLQHVQARKADININ